MAKTSVKVAKRKELSAEAQKPSKKAKLSKFPEPQPESSDSEAESLSGSDDDDDMIEGSESDESGSDSDSVSESESDSGSAEESDEESNDESEGESEGEFAGFDQEEDKSESTSTGSNTASNAAARAEQKRLREERKLARPFGETIQEIKKIWEKLRVKRGLTTKERTELANEAWALSKKNCQDLVLKHDSSRVIQTILKYSPKEQKEEITKALKGTYVELSKSSYGKYLVVKMLHYGSKQTRTEIVDELYGSFRKLMKHREGAYVIEDCYRDYASPEQKRQIVREFYGSEFAVFKDTAKTDKRDLTQILTQNPEKRPFLMKNLNDTITSAVNKGSIGFQIIHAAMLEYVKNINPTNSERDDFIDLIAEQFPEIVHTPEGSEVASRLLSMATAKQRKTLIKPLKAFVSKMALDDNGYLSLIALFDTVDDTVLVSKTFIADFTENIHELLSSQIGRRPFLYLFCGKSTRYFNPTVQKQFKIVDELKKNTSKKDDDTRRSELNKYLSPVVFEGLLANMDDYLKDPLACQTIMEALLYGKAEQQPNEQDLRMKTAEQLAKKIVKNSEQLLKENPFSSRMLRALIQGGHWNNTTKSVDVVPDAIDFKTLLVDELLSAGKATIESWATGEGSFAIVALLENGGDSSELVTALNKVKKQIKAAAAENKGAKLILEILN